MEFLAEVARQVLDSLVEEIAVIDGNGIIVYVNAAWTAFGRANGAPAEVCWVGTNYLNACHAAAEAGDGAAAEVARGFRGVLDGRLPYFQHEYPCDGPDEARWFLMRVVAVRGATPPLFVVTHHDITQRKLVERRVEALSRVDPLTGLANRRHLEDMLQDEWLRGMRARTPVSVLMIDIDHFKAYNDAHGHPAGDRCLMGVARVLQGFTRRPGDVAARYGGEEFAVVLGGTDGGDAVQVGGAIARAVRALGVGKPDADPVTVSIGVASTVPLKGQQPEGLVQRADAALYRAKHAGRDCLVEDAAPNLAQDRAAS